MAADAVSVAAMATTGNARQLALVFIGRSLQFGFLNTRLLHCRAPEPIAAAAIDLVRGPYNLDLPSIRTRFPRPRTIIVR
jgi:hypothetical protein